MSQAAIISEKFPHRVSAVFPNQSMADEACGALRSKAELEQEQVELVRPDDPGLERKLEHETTNIAWTLARSHVGLGIIGFIVGLVVAAVLWGAGFDFATTRPGWLFILAGAVGAVIGLLAAGLVTVRPDHEPVILRTEQASERGQWTVVAYARDEDEKHRVDEILKEHSVRVADSL